MKKKRYYGLWFYVVLFLMCLVYERDFMSYKYLFPTHILLIIAWWDGALNDLLGYVLKHYQFIIAHIFLWYILPDLADRFKKYLMKQYMVYRAKKKGRINPITPSLKTDCRPN